MNAPNPPFLPTPAPLFPMRRVLPCAAVAGAPWAKASAAFAPIKHPGGALLKPTLNAHPFVEVAKALAEMRAAIAATAPAYNNSRDP